MQRRSLTLLLLGLLGLAGALYFRNPGTSRQPQTLPASALAQSAARHPARNKTAAVPPVSPAVSNALERAEAARTARLAYRLSNTTQTRNELRRNDKVIDLANATLDTSKPLDLDRIPEALRAPADNGTYVVVAKGAVDEGFRALLRQAGAIDAGFIPNNARLVRVSAAGAESLAGSPGVQAVLPWEPYYKLDNGLLKLAVEQLPVPPRLNLNLTVFADALDQTVQALQALGADVLGQEASPFGPVLKVHPAQGTLAQVARLPGVQLVGQARARHAANDLTRLTLGVTPDPTTNTSWLGLTGTNVLITLADSGVDQTHPDLTNRVFGDIASSLVDTSGHGTFVAGTMIGSGVMSATATNAIGSPGTNFNFRGIAPMAQLYSLQLNQNQGALEPDRILRSLSIDYAQGTVSDGYLQESAVKRGSSLINNSWTYLGAQGYDIQAADWDAAVRDARPGTPGAQPLTAVFAAGNSGGGDEVGDGGNPESVESPATAKNVITVGAIEQKRNISTSFKYVDATGTNTVNSQPYLQSSDAVDQVANFSSRGNVGIGIEGDFGRFKPDLIAPGTFLISDRSAQWDTNSYYFPTNSAVNVIENQSVDPGALYPYGLFVPDNAIAVSIQVTPTRTSPNPFPAMPIYVRWADNPTTNVYDFVGSNGVVHLPADLPLTQNTSLFYSVGNTTTQAVSFNVVTVISTTNDNPVVTYFLRTNLNQSIAPFYRYESGTSMAAAGVSGLLALMQEFFEQHLYVTNSPALMKALLINGARSVGQSYDFQVQNLINYQGWGLPLLTNSLPLALASLTNSPPGDLTNQFGAGTSTLPLQFFDQTPTNVLATGQSFTRKVSLTPGGQQQDLRITLVWTDPPGNPAAGVKLVNDLDLIVTNLETGDVFLGNDIPAGADFNQGWDTNAVPTIDSINNVENVYLSGPLGSNYAVTVYARRVNVNAVSANTNNVVQDFALVISSGDGGTLTNAFTVTVPPAPLGGFSAASNSVLMTLSNGIPLMNQRVGANSQYVSGTNGVTNQWNFYVYTNTPSLTNASFTNVAFVTFLPPELGVTRVGAQQTDPNNAARFEGDVDLYVSTNSALTNLNPGAVAGAYQSRSREGTEKVLLSSQPPGQVYYIAVKSEDQEGSQFALLGVATDLAFNRKDPNGNPWLTPLTGFPLPIPDGAPSLPGATNVLMVTTDTSQARRVIVTNNFAHARAGDLIGTLTHGQKFVVLNNHTPFDNGGASEVSIYDDSGEGDITPAKVGSIGTPKQSDGPGSLRTFVGDNVGSGVWIMTMVDDTPTETGIINQFDITVEPSSPNNHYVFDVPPHGWRYYFIDVPAAATNLMAVVSSNSLTLDLYMKRGADPTLTDYDKFRVVNPPGGPVGGALSINRFDSPPLNPGTYYVGIYNPNNTDVAGILDISLALDLRPAQVFEYLSSGGEAIPDDAVTYSTNHVGDVSHVVSAEVGVRIDSPRVSDYALTLISPQGTRVLLAENRGGLSTNGYGSGLEITNVFPTSTAGDFHGGTNTLNVGLNQGLLLISYDFFQIPDIMDIYYDGRLIYSTGRTNGARSFAVSFGPGISTDVVIIMDQGGGALSTEWQYTATVVTRTINYATFTEDATKASVPIKFYPAPFTVNSAFNRTLLSGFEAPTGAGDYLAGGALVDGWSVLSNKVTVVNDPALANTGNQYLNLRNGSIARTIPTVGGDVYVLNFAYRRSPPLNPVHWWPADNSTVDVIAGSNGQLELGATYGPGEVTNAFLFDGQSTSVLVPADPSLDLGNQANTNGFTLDCWINPTGITNAQPLIEWHNQNSTIGAQFWISVTNGLGGPGSLYADLVDVYGAPSALSTAPGLVTSNTWQHVALSYNKQTGVAKLYYNGVVAASTNLGVITPLTWTDLNFGARVDVNSGVAFGGRMDEIAFYNHALTDAQVQDIFQAGSLGRCGSLNPPDVCPACSANVTLNGVPLPTIRGTTNGWSTNTVPFTARSTNCPVEIDHTNGISGLLFDTFVLAHSPGGPYLLPEEALDKIVGEPSVGDWQLEIVDNRAGPQGAKPQIVSWELSLVLENSVPLATPLVHGIPQSVSVNANQTRYFSVDVPTWAAYATNTLTTAGALNLYFNQTVEPTGTNAGDYTLTTPRTLLHTTGTPPLLAPGLRYYLGVHNPGVTNVPFTIEVDFNLTQLANMVPVTTSIPAGTDPQYYQFDVAPGGAVAAFEILGPSGDVNLVARSILALPDLATYDYLSDNAGQANEAIVVVSNSVPVALAPGRWYLGVFNNDTNTVSYTIRASEPGPPHIIDLANGVPVTFQSQPGVALTNFFRYTVSNTNSVVFALTNLSGNVDLTLQGGAYPYAEPFHDLSASPGTTPEQLFLLTSLLGTNINNAWYLGVPNSEAFPVTYTIVAVEGAQSIVNAAPLKVTASAQAISPTSGRSSPGRRSPAEISGAGFDGPGPLDKGVKHHRRWFASQFHGNPAPRTRAGCGSIKSFRSRRKRGSPCRVA